MSTNTIQVYLENNDDLMDLGWVSIRLYSATSPTATFGGLLSTTALVAATLTYDITDTTGTVATWYRYALYNGATESAQSDPFRPGQTLRSFRAQCANDAKAGSSGTCSSAGTVTTLIDSALLMSGVDAYFHEGDWLYRGDAGTATDKLRRVSEAGFSTTTGALTIPSGYPWSVLPALAEAYDLFSLVPPVAAPGVGYCWDDAIRDGIRDVWFDDTVNLGVGTSTGQQRYSLQRYGDLITRDSITSVMFRTTDTNNFLHDRLLGTNGTAWYVQENDTDGLTLVLSEKPTTDESVIVKVQRRFALPYVDSDVITGPLSLALAAANRQLFWKLEGEKGSRYAEWQGRYRQEFRVYGAKPRVLV